MPNLETPDELAEQIADWCGVYGAAEHKNDYPDTCKCRMCFIGEVVRRIRESVRNEQLLTRAEEVLK